MTSTSSTRIPNSAGNAPAARRFLIINNSYFGKHSGANRYFLEISRRLQTVEDVEVSILTTHSSRVSCQQLGITKVRYFEVSAEKPSKLRNYWKDNVERGLKASQRLKLSEKVIIYSASDRISDILPAYRLRGKADAVWIASFFHFVPPPFIHFKWPPVLVINDCIRWLENKTGELLIRHRSDVIFTESSFVVDRFSETGVSSICLRGGIDAQLLDSIESSGELFDACFVGRLFEYKGIYDLLKCWRLVCKAKHGARLLVIGEGSNKEVQRVKKYLERNALQSNVVLELAASDTQKIQLLKSSRLFVFPSYAEGVPIAFFEVMYCGLPIVAYNLPSYVDVAGYIETVSLGDIEGLSLKVLELLHNKEKHVGMALRGKEYAAKHGWNSFAEQFIVAATENA